jgi:hypothetical protein
MNINVHVTGKLEHLVDKNLLEIELPENNSTRDFVYFISEKHDSKSNF